MIIPKEKKEKIDFHVHPYFENYDLEPIVDVMEKKNFGILGLPNYNTKNYSLLKQATKKLSLYKVEPDGTNTAVRMENKENGKKSYLLRATELMNQGNLHLIVIGNTSGLTPYQDIQKNIETGIKNNAVVIVDHPFADADHEYKSITRKKEKELEDLVKEFGDEITWEWNSYCIPYLRATLTLPFINKYLSGDLTSYDVNSSVEKFASKLKEKGYNVNLVADSDVHARNKRLLEGIGAAHIKVDKERIDYSSGQNIVNSLKQAVREGEGVGYENHKGYTSFSHFVEAFGIPAVFKLAKRRG